MSLGLWPVRWCTRAELLELYPQRRAWELAHRSPPKHPLPPRTRRAERLRRLRSNGAAVLVGRRCPGRWCFLLTHCEHGRSIGLLVRTRRHVFAGCLAPGA